MGSRSSLTVVSALVPALERFAIMTFERTGVAARARRSSRSAPRAFLWRLGASILCISSLIVFAPPAISKSPSSPTPMGNGQPRRVEQSGSSDRIAYSSRNCPGMEDYGSTDCTFEIFTVGLEGGEPQQLTSTYGTDDIHPVYSPDGTEIAFNSWEKVWGCDSHLWLMEADGSNPRMISSPVNAWDESFSWSPEGEIAFTRWPNGPTCEYGYHANVYLLSRVGEAWTEEPLLTRPGSEYKPAFSPNGRRIAYGYDSDGDAIYAPGETNQSDIWISRADGTRHQRLTRTRRLYEGSATWSPDGKWLAFERGTTGNYWWRRSGSQIWMMRADGALKKRLTSKGYTDVEPAWSPDGKMIAFTRCSVNGAFDCAIAVIDLVRPNRIKVVADSEGHLDVMPSWQPAAQP
jgi:Tol biopolymer transport system component